MSANETDFDAEYRFVDGKTFLNAVELNRRFLSLHQRLNGAEARGEGYDGLIAQGIGAALKRINDGVAPLLAALLAQVAEAETALDLLQGQVAGGIQARDIRFMPPTGSGLSSGNAQDAIVEVLATLQVLIAAGTASAVKIAKTISARDLYLSGF